MNEYKVEKCPKYGSVDFTTAESPEYKTFASQPLIPANLTNTVPQGSCHKESQPFPDYDAYFMTAVLLQNDVLASFLQTLQPHLEDIQVWLGAIESWILESQSIVDFLNNLFEENLEIKDFTSTTSEDSAEVHIFIDRQQYFKQTDFITRTSPPIAIKL